MLAVRLSDGEALLLCALSGGAGRIAHLEAAAGPGCHPAPRRDSHAWFMLTGKHAVACLRKFCGVDLRLHKFADHAVAQTSVARLSRSEEHTSELQSLMRISYAVFCLKKKK